MSTRDTKDGWMDPGSGVEDDPGAPGPDSADGTDADEELLEEGAV